MKKRWFETAATGGGCSSCKQEIRNALFLFNSSVVRFNGFVCDLTQHAEELWVITAFVTTVLNWEKKSLNYLWSIICRVFLHLWKIKPRVFSFFWCLLYGYRISLSEPYLSHEQRGRLLFKRRWSYLLMSQSRPQYSTSALNILPAWIFTQNYCHTLIHCPEITANCLN